MFSIRCSRRCGFHQHCGNTKYKHFKNTKMFRQNLLSFRLDVYSDIHFSIIISIIIIIIIIIIIRWELKLIIIQILSPSLSLSLDIWI